MDKQTLLAVVLSVVVISAGFMIQNALYPPQPVEQASPSPAEAAPTTGTQDTSVQSTATGSGTDSSVVRQSTVAGGGPVVAVPDTDISTAPVVYRNDLMEVVFDPAGARVVSIKLLEHPDGDKPVEMVWREESERGAFELHFGDYQAVPVMDTFRRVSTTDSNVISFSRDFYVQGNPDSPFTVVRSYRMYPDEYMFEVSVEIQNSVNEYVPLDFSGISYSLTYGPQIGPSYAELDNRNEYRRFSYFLDGKRKNIRTRQEDVQRVDERVQWIAVTGKYFAVIAVPGATDYGFVVSNQTPEGLRDGAMLAFERPVIRSASNRDVIRFFVGPKVSRVMDRYNDAEDNALGVRNLELNQAMDSRALFGWLESILKFMLQMIYKVIPNYGFAIILLTIIVKILLFPLTHKSYESTSKMQQLNPKIQELRTKYKDNPQKMNAEMAAMYKKEGVNPMGGCLPMLIQFPFFIAMFGLFNNHFDLRGASFISGWIVDLSAPESIWNFGGYALPLLGWTDLRLLPILFVGSQLLSSKLMQTPTTGADNSQMKMMQYGMPIMFFFILYNMPSGLLVYWIFSNILTVAQQYYINTSRKRHSTE